MIDDARFDGNEYFVKYSELVEGRVATTLSNKDDGVETHHIVPKSIGGSNSSSNLVVLTVEEHYKAHFLLAMAFITKDNESAEAKKMAWAWDAMSNFKRDTKSLLPVYSDEDAKNYAAIREVAKKMYSDPEYRKNVEEGFNKYIESQDIRNMLSQRLKKQWENPEFREKMKQLTKTEKWKNRQRAAVKKLAKDPEWVKKVMDACIKRNNDPEYRKRRAEGIRKKSKDPEWRKNIMAAAEKRKNENKVWRERNAALLVRIHSDPEIRKKAAESQKKTWERIKNSPDYEVIKEKMRVANRKRAERIRNDPVAYAAWRESLKKRRHRGKKKPETPAEYTDEQQSLF